MKKDSSRSIHDDMRTEYDFRGAVRGKHYKPLHEGYSVRIRQPDGTSEVKRYVLAEGAVLLQPDVREYFPDSESVNCALRSLVALMSEMPREAFGRKKGHGAKHRTSAQGRSKAGRA